MADPPRRKRSLLGRLWRLVSRPTHDDGERRPPPSEAEAALLEEAERELERLDLTALPAPELEDEPDEEARDEEARDLRGPALDANDGERGAPAPVPLPGPPPSADADRELGDLLDDLRRGRCELAAAELPGRVLALIERLGPRQARRALAMLDRAVRLLPRAPELRLELAERLYRQRDLRAALPLLHDLAEEGPPWSLRAHFLLGDHHRREVDLRAALSHFERVLAWDFTYPRARPRADDLRSKLDRPVGTAAPTILGAGDVSAGSRFAIEREIGRGGGGAVYLAHDRNLDRRVAVKVLHPHVAQQAEARAHLFCEARIATSLHHPQIVTIYDLDEQLCLVAMEYCSGGTLADRIAAGPLPPADALERLAEVTRVLEAVHGCGVVHRDLKPANLLRRGTDDHAPLVLTDFGSAHAAAIEEQTAEVVGSRAYMAPEQRLGADADPRADLYACGVILVEMLLGRRALTDQQALQGVTPHELPDLWQALGERLPRPALPAADLARRLLSPAPDQRPAEARQVTAEARALARRIHEAADRAAVHAELVTRAGPSPDAAVQGWLDEQAASLL